MELDPQTPSALTADVERRTIKVQVTAMREFTIDIHPEDSVKDVERLVLSQVAQQGLQISGINVVEVSPKEDVVTTGDEILSSAVKDRAVLHMFNPDVSYPARNRLRANQPNKIPLYKDDNEQQTNGQGKLGKIQTLLTTSSGPDKLEDFSSLRRNRDWNSTVLFKDVGGEDPHVKLSASSRRRRARAKGKSLTQHQTLNAGFARRAERQGIANALEHRSRRHAKGVEKRLNAAAQRRWQGKSLTDEAKIDALNEALEKM
ncbi:hypothetical protein LTR10_018042 [Elasticomyces elasticus]|uniref:Uncharacterized protein n=1 Tax=Exophiala sideris TaxID=1016849 RepID=A0ABR0JPM5_9EURO|nr:hypothetical protein LTR10_018042 [Elasticomyces elasticus]KAK5039554.1 hypothetical protein LTS07_000048 [Exophiala sideris]KAK5041107.1 hypothetical protein LTR13_002581 [Exophiala sideris]KAK5067931.1 hypothetical protein LTR69_000048 [Exophiala sideris]KAK5187233.1 hypothetical protein LTR44_000048 [Eurotiomycetes sp. CCFEE 6388]